jgi:hypothetical protein
MLDDMPQGPAEVGPSLRAALDRFRRTDRPPLIPGTFDADGLSASAILVARLLARRRADPAEIRNRGRARTLVSTPMRAELEASRPGRPSSSPDLGVREATSCPGTPDRA